MLVRISWRRHKTGDTRIIAYYDPHFWKAIPNRIGQLRERLTEVDPDLEPDEIQIAIDRAEQKRKELADAQPAAKQSAKMISMLPKAADT